MAGAPPPVDGRIPREPSCLVPGMGVGETRHVRVSAQRQRPPSRERRHHRLQVTLPPPYPTRGGSRATVVGSRRERARHRGPQTRTRQGGGQTRDTGPPKPGHGGVKGKPETQGPPNQDMGETQGAPKPGHGGRHRGPPNQDSRGQGANL